jgi:integrase
VERARAALSLAGQDVSRLDGYTWHCNRHTFASRLAMAGVNLYTIQRLGGWQTFKMVQRYAHLAPGHYREAVERLVSAPTASAASGGVDAPEVSQECPSPSALRAGVS